MNKIRKCRSVFLLFLLICICSLSGCVRMNIGMEIKKNGKADASLLFAIMDTSVAGQDTFDSGEFREMKERLEKENWVCTEYNEDGYVGFQATIENVDLQKLGSELEADESLQDVNVSKDGDKYILDWQLFADEKIDQMKAAKTYITGGGGYLTFELRLPEEVIDSNATSVSSDNRTLTWDLLEESNIHAEFRLSNPISTIYYVLGALLVVVVIAVLIIVAVVKKKKTAAPAMNQNFYQPPYGQAPYGQNPYAQGQSESAPYGQNPYGQSQNGQFPYGQNPYGQPQNSQTPYGQNPYGQPQNSQTPYGQNPYGQPQNSQTPYGQNPYGQPQNSQTPYGQNPYGQPQNRSESDNNPQQ